MTTRALNAREVNFLHEVIVERLSQARARERETKGQPEWLYWSARADGLGDAAATLDGLCAALPWPEPSPAVTV